MTPAITNAPRFIYRTMYQIIQQMPLGAFVALGLGCYPLAETYCDSKRCTPRLMEQIRARSSTTAPACSWRIDEDAMRERCMSTFLESYRAEPSDVRGQVHFCLTCVDEGNVSAACDYEALRQAWRGCAPYCVHPFALDFLSKLDEALGLEDGRDFVCAE